MINLLDDVLEDMKEHIVNVVLPGDEDPQKLILIEIYAKAKIIDLLAEAYGAKFTKTYKDMLEKLYGSAQQDLTFGVFFDKTEMKFALCREFQELSSVIRPPAKVIILKPIDKVVIDLIATQKAKEAEEERKESLRPIINQTINRNYRSSPGSGKVLYSLTEKEPVK